MKKLLIMLCALLLTATSCIALRNADGSQPDETKPATESETETETETETDTEMETDTETETETEPVPAVPFEGVSVSFIAAGDNLIHPNIYDDAGFRGTAEKPYDFLPMYADVASRIAAADIAFINQESLMAGEDYGYTGWPCFNCPQQLGLDMVSLGFDVVNMANNHMLDKGIGGLEATINFWNSQPVTRIGSYLNQADYDTIRVTEKEGVRFAWLSYTYGTNGIEKPADSPLIVPYIDDALIFSDLARAEEVGDFTIVSIHWGNENTQTPTDEQYRLAKLLADNGADVILGHHSHTLQPIEWIETDRGRTLCIYSLGNFVSGMSNPVNMVGGLLNFTVDGDGKGGLTVNNVFFEPTVFYYDMGWYNTHLYLIGGYSADVAYGHGVGISGYTLTPEEARAYVTNVMDDEFLAH